MDTTSSETKVIESVFKIGDETVAAITSTMRASLIDRYSLLINQTMSTVTLNVLENLKFKNNRTYKVFNLTRKPFEIFSNFFFLWFFIQINIWPSVS